MERLGLCECVGEESVCIQQGVSSGRGSDSTMIDSEGASESTLSIYDDLYYFYAEKIQKLMTITIVQLFFGIYFYMHVNSSDNRDLVTSFPCEFKVVDGLEGEDYSRIRGLIESELTRSAGFFQRKMVFDSNGSASYKQEWYTNPYIFYFIYCLNYILDCCVKRILCDPMFLSVILLKTFFILENLIGVAYISSEDHIFLSSLLKKYDISKCCFVEEEPVYLLERLLKINKRILLSLMCNMIGFVKIAQINFTGPFGFPKKHFDAIWYWVSNYFLCLANPVIWRFFIGSLVVTKMECKRIATNLCKHCSTDDQIRLFFTRPKLGCGRVLYKQYKNYVSGFFQL
jgi:hypothetical protein